MFYFEEINGKKILKSSVLNGLQHFFTTRESVIKTKEPDFEETVKENKKDICKFLGIEEENLIHPSQTHTSNVEIARAGISSYPDTDGLILANHKQAVYLNFADCTPVIIFDPINQIAAVSHAGWRGTAGNIASKTVQKMKAEFGSNPENLSAAIHKIRTIATKIISNVIQSPFPYIYEPQNKSCAHIIRQFCNKG